MLVLSPLPAVPGSGSHSMNRGCGGCMVIKRKRDIEHQRGGIPRQGERLASAWAGIVDACRVEVP